jgi:hypothetical protein
MLRLVALHDVPTGIALRPQWGPMYGPETVSEQQLAERALVQAPAESVIIGGGNFGIFSFAYAVVQSQRKVLFRLTKQRAKALGADMLYPNGEARMCWRPTRKDRRKNSHFPEDAQVQGRLLVVTQKGFRSSLYLFTKEDECEKVVALYAQRWNMELDLRTLKRTLRLHHLRGKSKAAVEKELLIAVVAYGLVRSVDGPGSPTSRPASPATKLHPRLRSGKRAHGKAVDVGHYGKTCATVRPAYRIYCANQTAQPIEAARISSRSVGLSANLPPATAKERWCEN